MKAIFLWVCVAMLLSPVRSRGEDAAVEERLNKLSAQIQDLMDARDAQDKQIKDLARQVRDLQDQQSKAGGSSASSDEVKQLATKIQEVDDKRQHDNELIVKEIQKLGKTLGTPATPARTPRSSTTSSGSDTSSTSPVPDKGHHEYTIAEGDTLNAIAKAYTDQGMPVTTDQILKANPGLKERSLRVGQKIVIPMQ